jgi:CelD/BcsL family acetyltransferase involved in cellulose biosynthesis
VIGVNLATRWEDFPGGRDAWNKLVAMSPEPSVFLTWEWLTAWWRVHAAEAGLRLWFAGGSTPRLAGAFVQCTRRPLPGMNLRVLQFCGAGTGDSHNLDLAGDTGLAAALIREIMDGDADWDLLELSVVPAESEAAHGLIGAAADRGWRTEVHRWTRQVVLLPTSFDEYVLKLSARSRRRLRYTRRQFERMPGFEIRRCAGESEAAAAFERLVALETRRRTGVGGTPFFDDKRSAAILSGTLGAMERNGWLDLWTLIVGGRIAGAHLGYRFHGRHAFVISAFDSDLARHSPGAMLLQGVVEGLIRDGVHGIDFLGGEDEYKRHWGTTRLEYLRIRCARPRSPAHLYLGARSLIRGARAAIRKSVPRPVRSMAGAGWQRLFAGRPGPLENEG